MKKKVALYVRVSTLEQAESGYSIGEQIDKLKKFADIKDWVDEHDDDNNIKSDFRDYKEAK